jgi:hypothetical protein
MRRGGKRLEKTLDRSMIEALREGGTSLPPSERAEFYRESLLAAAAKARSELGEGLAGPAREPAFDSMWMGAGKTAARHRRVFTLPRVAAACFVILALLVGMGFASTYAMPGNPLYCVRRGMEKVRLAFTPGGESEANLLVSNAERRLDEFEYAGEREMTGWYASLAMDAGRDILKALAESRDLPEEKAAAIRSRAFELLRRLESLLFATLRDIPRERSEELQQEVGELREELWPEGIPPDWVDPWADLDGQEKPVQPVPPSPPVEPVPPVPPFTPGGSAPPIDPPVPTSGETDRPR